MIINALTGEQMSFEDFFKQLAGGPGVSEETLGNSGDEPADDDTSISLRAALVQDVMSNLDTFNCYSAADVANSAEGLFQYIITGKVPE